MIGQLEDSIKFDCYDRSPIPAVKSGEQYRMEQIADAEKTIDRNIKYREEEIARVEGANAWITALYRSLPGSGQ